MTATLLPIKLVCREPGHWIAVSVAQSLTSSVGHCSQPDGHAVEPVQAAEQSSGAEVGGLAEPGTGVGRLGGELESCIDGKLQFGCELQTMRRIDGGDSPEVDDLAWAELLAVTPPTAQAHTADETVGDARSFHVQSNA